ncbi:hypothetical protein BJ138DRAFT_1007227 [Hygrophoropsis aurantiaca]|uniref:Uncharacterized protein n=1 Tax=Hygrophoropsis aurantiaca TaxID=72124 RepID=A0ACB8AE87_9AGAM|nr:hypothetical protein BJ138DRAFT_1007227 [Hygrophoropsis aurantiaca]
MITLAFACVYSLALSLSKEDRWRTYFYITYTIAMTILGTLYTAFNARTIQLAYVNHKDFSAGPTVYDAMIYHELITILGTTTYVIANWMADALILWRFTMLYRELRYWMIVVAFPFIIFIGVIVTGFLVMIKSTRPGQSLYSKSAVAWAIPYYSLSLSLNVITTGLMAIRLYQHKRRLEKILGPGHASLYTTVTAMLIESCALFALWSIITLVLYIIGNPDQFVFVCALSQVQIIAPLLIIFRVAQGKAWTRSTENNVMSTIQVARPSTNTQESNIASSHDMSQARLPHFATRQVSSSYKDLPASGGHVK